MARRSKQDDDEPKAPGRPVWTGTLAFGLVNIPVSLYALETSDNVKFRMVDRRDHAPIRYERVNENTGAQVPWGEIVKAYDYSDDNLVVMTDEDFDQVASEATKTLEVEAFVPRAEVSVAYFERPYVVVPKKRSEKGYVLLREAMRDSDRLAVGRIVLRNKESLAALMPQGDALVMVLMRFAHELRDAAAYPLPTKDIECYNVKEQEVKLARQLIDAMSAEWDPEQYQDRYRVQLLEYIDEKVKAGGLTPVRPAAAATPDSATVIDLAGLLRQSMEAAQLGESQNGGKKEA